MVAEVNRNKNNLVRRTVVGADAGQFPTVSHAEMSRLLLLML